MTINETTYAIAMTRGDSESITVANTTDGTWASGDIITMTVRDDAEGDIMLQKVVTEFDENGAAVIAIDPADTAGLEFGTYVYDIQFTDADGTVIHLVPSSPGRLPKFKITEEATY